MIKNLVINIYTFYNTSFYINNIKNYIQKKPFISYLKIKNSVLTEIYRYTYTFYNFLKKQSFFKSFNVR